MVGERDREEAVRWEENIDDAAAISIPPPFNTSYNGPIPYNNRQQQQQYAAIFTGGGMSDDMQGHWDDEQMGLMGENDNNFSGAPAHMEKGVRFPDSPSHAAEFFTGQLSQAPLQSAHSRYILSIYILKWHR
jgi:hypothetical protein